MNVQNFSFKVKALPIARVRLQWILKKNRDCIHYYTGKPVLHVRPLIQDLHLIKALTV